MADPERSRLFEGGEELADTPLGREAVTDEDSRNAPSCDTAYEMKYTDCADVVVSTENDFPTTPQTFGLEDIAASESNDVFTPVDIPSCSSAVRDINNEDGGGQDDDFRSKMTRYQAHLRMVLESRDIPYLQLTWDEFLLQQPVDDSEFGPNENLDTIYIDCMNLPCHWRDRYSEYRRRSNRYLESKAKKNKWFKI